MKRRLPLLWLCLAGGGLTACHEKPASEVPVMSHSLPSATEVFNLRSECVALGKKLLDEKENEVEPSTRIPTYHWTYSFSEASHYNPETNRCYVELDNNEGDKTRPLYEGFLQDLYDGQTGDLLAHVETVPAKDGIQEKHFGMVYVNHQRKGIEIGGALTGDAWVKADLEDQYEDTQTFISDAMADDRKQ